MNTFSALNTFCFINHADTVFIHGNGIYRTASLTWTHQICNGIIRTCLGTFSAFPAERRIDICPVPAHGNSTEITCLLTGLSHTALTVIGYNISGDRTSFTGRRNDLYNVFAVFIPGAFSFCQTDTLANHFTLLIYTTSKLCLWSGNHFKR